MQAIPFILLLLVSSSSLVLAADKEGKPLAVVQVQLQSAGAVASVRPRTGLCSILEASNELNQHFGHP